MPEGVYDILVVGGGIIGLATARAILQRHPSLSLRLLEKEPRLAAHQTGRNSGVIHSGIYYRPGSLKAKLCVESGALLRAFCDAHRIPYHTCGKVIVAVEERERSALDRLYERGQANGVAGLTRIGPAQLRALEPQARGLSALHLPHVAIVDFAAVAEALAGEVRQGGGVVQTSTRLTAARRVENGWRIGTTQGMQQARWLINCGGLHADRIARAAGDDAPVRIVPFRGEYYTVRAERAALVRGLIYPVPDPALPFLGVHFTKMLDGGVHVGPNAVPALAREGYRRTDVSLRDCAELAGFSGTWRLAARHWRTAIDETRRSWSRRAFLSAARRLVPSLTLEDLQPSPSGVRAQAVGNDGALLDDFVLRQTPDALHVLNAPSPAATASLAIGEAIVGQLAAPLSALAAAHRHGDC